MNNEYSVLNSGAILQLLPNTWQDFAPRPIPDGLKAPTAPSISPSPPARPLDREVARAYGTSTTLNFLTPAQLALPNATE